MLITPPETRTKLFALLGEEGVREIEAQPTRDLQVSMAWILTFEATASYEQADKVVADMPVDP